MPYKQVLFRSAAREKILRGVTQLTGCRPRDSRAAIEIGADREKVGRADRL